MPRRASLAGRAVIGCAPPLQPTAHQVRREEGSPLMHAIARIRFDGGMLMLPSRTPYEIELLLENLDWYTARHEAVQLEIDNHRWRVAHGSSDRVEECARCHRARATLTFVNGGRVPLCVACARVAVGSRFADWPRPE